MDSSNHLLVITLAKVLRAYKHKYPDSTVEQLANSLNKFFKKKIDDDLFKQALDYERITTTLEPVELVKATTRSLLDSYFDKQIPYCVRFAPCPSNYATIGHFKGFFWNYYFAKRSNGKLILRFDDTNTDHNYLQAYKESFINMGIDSNFQFTIDQSSAHLEEYVQACKTLIVKKDAYICNCIRRNLTDVCTTACFFNNTEEALANLLETKTGVVRLNTDSAVLLRPKLVKSTGQTTFLPTLLLQGVVDDYRSQINLIIRGRDLESLSARQKILYELLYEKQYPKVIYWGRITLFDSSTGETFASSKRKITSNTNPLIAVPFYHAFINTGVKTETMQKVFFEKGLTKHDTAVDIRNFYKKKPTLKSFSEGNLFTYLLVNKTKPFFQIVRSDERYEECIVTLKSKHYYAKNSKLYESFVNP